MTETSGAFDLLRVEPSALGSRAAAHALRRFAVMLAAGWCVAFMVVGLSFRLQMYGDGSLFSYAVAAQDSWAFHWHNISGRLTVFLYAHLPAQAYVGWSGDAYGGVVLYGFLFFAAPLLGLAATYAADRSHGRVIFGYACASTATLCPLVFGFPTEVWLSHALFWPALAICHYARHSAAGLALTFAVLLALMLTHGGAVLFAAAILISVALRGPRDARFLRTAALFVPVIAVCGAVRIAWPPDPYFARVLASAALHVFDIGILTDRLLDLLLAALAGYVAGFAALRWLGGSDIPDEKIHLYAGSIVAVALAAYWTRFDDALHSDNRYYLRTVLIVATPGFGLLAAAIALSAEGRLKLRVLMLPPFLALIGRPVTARLAAGALAVITLIHVVETAKFASGWNQYTAAIRNLAIGAASDPALGDDALVSSLRIAPALNRLSWFSTTPYLSVLVAPKLQPRRLVVDPDSGYFWLSCRTATNNLRAARAVPRSTRRLVQREACLHK